MNTKHLGICEITQGNINNNHINLRELIDKFPADVQGGRNKAAAALKQISVDYGGVSPIETDIDETKKIFRNRKFIREFFERHKIKKGGRVAVDEIGPYKYKIYLAAS